MSQLNLNDVIQAEELFFQGTFTAQEHLSSARLEQFRAETVSMRRERLSKELFAKMQGRVGYGPFKGLELDPLPGWGQSDLGSMLLGCYEIEVMAELHSSEFQARRHFVDVGAADGYYAVGTLANGRFDSADCFELTEIGRETIARNAARNAVEEKIRVLGEADSNLPMRIPETDWSNTVILCDIEGAEFTVLDQKCLERMQGAMIIIEIHNWVSDFWSRYCELLERASQYFELRFLESSGFPTHELPELRSMPDDNRMLLLSEGRPNVMRFLQLVS